MKKMLPFFAFTLVLFFVPATAISQELSLLDKNLEKCSEKELLELKVESYRQVAARAEAARSMGTPGGTVRQLAEAQAAVAAAEIDLYRHTGETEKLLAAHKVRVEALKNRLEAANIQFQNTGTVSPNELHEAEIALLDAILAQKREEKRLLFRSLTHPHEIGPPKVIITASYPGASAETVADTVALPIEKQVNGVHGMLSIATSCTNGAMEIVVTFEPGTDLDMAMELVQNRVKVAEPTLPVEVTRQGVTVKKLLYDAEKISEMENESLKQKTQELEVLKQAATQTISSDENIAELFAQKKSDVQVEGAGTVLRLLEDDDNGGKHQRFILKLQSGQTLLIAHNIDLASRLDGLALGETVAFFGKYYYNKEGGAVHWTHRDPQKKHVDGWLKWKEKTYQ